MAMLGFRRPQFSEEAAWLPDWLQDSQATALNELTKETQIQVSEGNCSGRKASEDGRYNSCHLFLSGTDKSASSHASASESVLHLHLHLSSDGNLQSTQSVSLNNYQVDTAKASTSESEKVISPPEVRQNTMQFYSHGISGTEHFLTKPTAMDNPEVGSIALFSKEKTHMETIKDVHHNYGNFDHAVELSIAASEALLIHELLEEESLDVVKASALLDISLKVKQARLLRLEEDSLSNDHIKDISEYLSDIEDSTMVDAFVDVGLCTNSPGDCYASDINVSRVSETPQTHLDAGCSFGRSEVPTLEDALNCATEKIYEENSDMGRKIDFMDNEYPLLERDIGGLELITSGQGDEKLEMTELQAGFNMPKPDSTPTQPQLVANSSQSQDHEIPDDCLLKYPPLSGYNSGWFGGWTGKSRDDCYRLTIDTKVCTTKALVVETSSLSESVDIPDMSSYVSRQESKHLASLLACTAANDVTIANMVEDEALISPEMPKNSSCSRSLDPLCSVVPCSYQSETSQSMQNGHNFQKSGEYLGENDTSFAPKLVPDSLNLTSERILKVQGTTDKDSDPIFQKQSGSLNKYSGVIRSRTDVVPVPIYNEQLLFQSNGGKISCPRKTNNGAYNACGNAITTASYCKTTGAENPRPKDQTSTGNLTNDLTVSNNNVKSGARFRTLPPEQQFPGINIMGINHPQALEEQFIYNKIDSSASQRGLDDFPCLKQSHSPPNEVALDINNLRRKRVQFKDKTSELEQSNRIHLKKRKTGSGFASNLKSKMLTNMEPGRETSSQKVKKKLTNYRPCKGDKLIFHGLEFLLTGMPKKREKELRQLVIRYGGIVLFDIPSSNSKGKISLESPIRKLPVVLCLKKVETTKFLYGCAVNAYILKVNWLLDSVSAGSVLQPEKYTIFSNQTDGYHALSRSPHVCKLVFEGVGIMFHGKHKFCTRFSKIFKYGGGCVFKALQRLVQSSKSNKLTSLAVVAEDLSMVSRHLKLCASEKNIPIVSASWIISSLLSGKCLPFTENDNDIPKPVRTVSRQILPLSFCPSQEI